MTAALLLLCFALHLMLPAPAGTVVSVKATRRAVTDADRLALNTAEDRAAVKAACAEYVQQQQQDELGAGGADDGAADEVTEERVREVVLRLLQLPGG